jgi:hypothetical protein
MLKACRAPDKVRKDIERRVKFLGNDTVAMTVHSTERNDDPNHPDRLRTMFVQKAKPKTTGEQPHDRADDWKEVMDALQIVDSEYAMNRLSKSTSVGAFLDSYRFCLNVDMRSSAGCFFERIIHQSVNTTGLKPTVSRACFSEGTSKDSLQQLTGPGVYWIPSVSNFASIDSALVCDHTLYSFQMTIMDRRAFNVDSFQRKFAETVKATFAGRHDITGLVVYTVVPLRSKFVSPKVVDENDKEVKPDDVKLSNLKFITHKVNMRDLDTILGSVRQLMNTIHPVADPQPPQGDAE